MNCNGAVIYLAKRQDSISAWLTLTREFPESTKLTLRLLNNVEITQYSKQ